MIEAVGLTKQYGGRSVVDEVSFTLEPGTVTGFLGPNGAGKTTTMRMITGLVPATSGSARFSSSTWGRTTSSSRSRPMGSAGLPPSPQASSTWCCSI